MDILVTGFVIGIFVAPILVIWLWVRMVRRDRARAAEIEAGGAHRAPVGYAERRLAEQRQRLEG